LKLKNSTSFALCQVVYTERWPALGRAVLIGPVGSSHPPLLSPSRLSCWLGLCLERSSSWLHRLRLSGLHFESRAGTSVTARPNHHLQPKRTPQSHEAQSRIAKALPDIAVSVQG
jgi:hypothetical protein